MNSGKTKYMCKYAPQKMYRGCNEIEWVLEYAHLGHIMSFVDKMEKKLKH